MGGEKEVQGQPHCPDVSTYALLSDTPTAYVRTWLRAEAEVYVMDTPST